MADPPMTHPDPMADPSMTHSDPQARAGKSLTAKRNTCSEGSMATAECDSGLDPDSGVVGVTHVGLLRAGAARQVVAALADGQVLVYRENGELSSYCSVHVLDKLTVSKDR